MRNYPAPRGPKRRRVMPDPPDLPPEGWAFFGTIPPDVCSWCVRDVIILDGGTASACPECDLMYADLKGAK